MKETLQHHLSNKNNNVIPGHLLPSYLWDDN